MHELAKRSILSFPPSSHPAFPEVQRNMKTFSSIRELNLCCTVLRSNVLVVSHSMWNGVYLTGDAYVPT